MKKREYYPKMTISADGQHVVSGSVVHCGTAGSGDAAVIPDKSGTERYGYMKKGKNESSAKNTGFFMNRWFRTLISLAGICLLVYFFVGIHSVDLIGRIRIYFDATTLALLGAAVLLMLYMSGLALDFVNGFRLAITGGKDVPLEKMHSAAEAVVCAERTAVAAGILIFVPDILDMLSSLNHYESLELFLLCCDIPLGIIFFDILYPALFLLVLTPVKARLKKMIIVASVFHA